MQLVELDSRSSLGSDIERIGQLNWQRDYAGVTLLEASNLSPAWVELKSVRVVVARLGGLVRLSAPALDVVVDCASLEEAWRSFLDTMAARPDGPWLTFDIGPTRREEINEGLDVDPDESWAEPEEPGID